MSTSGDMNAIALQYEIQRLTNKVDALNVGYRECLDTIWVLLATVLAFILLGGSTLVESSRAKPTKERDYVPSHMVVVAMGFVCWYFWGFAFAFGVSEDPNGILGTKYFTMDDFGHDLSLFRQWLYEGASFVVTVALALTSVAERMQTIGYCLWAFMLISVEYPIVAYWVKCEEGWVRRLDFGSDAGVVDRTGNGASLIFIGIVAFWSCKIIGPREGLDPASREKITQTPRLVMGIIFVWLGWCGLNVGGTLSLHDQETSRIAVKIVMNMTLAASASLVLGPIALIKLSVQSNQVSLGHYSACAIAGLAVVTSCCDLAEPWAAVLLGAIAPFCYTFANIFLMAHKIDDPTHVIPTYGACGLLGWLAAPFFVPSDQILPSLGIHIIAIISIVVWVTPMALCVLLTLRSCVCFPEIPKQDYTVVGSTSPSAQARTS